jgi:hypothetical protein
MPRKSPYVIELSEQEREVLEVQARRYTLPYRDVLRATKEKAERWTRWRAFAQVRHSLNIQLLPYSLVRSCSWRPKASTTTRSRPA